MTKRDVLVTRQPTPKTLYKYGHDIPQALLQLLELFTQATIMPEETAPNKGDTTLPPSNIPASEPDQATPPQVHKPNQPSFPVQIAPTGQTRTGRCICTPTHFGYTMYHCSALAKSAMAHIMDYHLLALLQMFASTIKQPDGYPDMMPLHIALQQPDWDKFIDAMAKELKPHTELKHWKVIHKSQVPKTIKPLPMVWTLQCKCDPAGEIVKWKASLCARGHCQVYGDMYWTTFAPVVSWTTVSCIFILVLLVGWHM